MTKTNKTDQLVRFQKAARDAGADMTKEEFACVIGGLAKPTPPAPDQKPEADQAADE